MSQRTAPTSVPAAATVEGFQLSPQQRQLWRQLGYRRGWIALDLAGPLDGDRLRAALSALVQEHEILRTGFSEVGEDGYPLQVIAEQAHFDWQQIAAERQPLEAALAAGAAAEGESSSALQATLVVIGGEHHLLLLSLPRLAADRATWRLLASGVAAAYGGEVPVETLAYADYADWQNELLEEAGEGAAAWQRQLDQELSGERLGLLIAPAGSESASSEPATSEPATSKPQPPEWRALELHLESATVERLAALGAQHGAGLEAGALAAWLVVLWRFTGQTRAALARLASGRHQAELAAILGPCSRLLPVSCFLATDVTFGELLGEVVETLQRGEQSQAWCAAEPPAHQPADLPHRFESNAGALAVETVDGLRITELAIDCPSAGGSVSLLLEGSAEDARWSLSVDDRRLGMAASRVLAMAVAEVASAAALDPHRSVADFDLLSAAGRSQMLADSAGPGVESGTARADFDAGTDWPDSEPRLDRRFVAQARQASRAIALEAAGQTLTYGELLDRVDRLASRLRAAGVGRESLVALRVERSFASVVAVLAVLRAGGAFQALDGRQPPIRQAELLAASGARWLLVDDDSSVPDGFAGQVLAVDTAPAEVAPPSSDLEIGGGDDLAYVVFTSGSTGRPKGVLSLHRGAASYLSYVRQTYSVDAGMRVLQLASLSFDAAVRDLLGPLTAGATVVLLPAAAAGDPLAVVTALAEQQIDAVLSIVPSLLRAVLGSAEEAIAAGELEPARLHGRLRWILASGERLPVADCHRARRLFGDQLTVVNQYGPTETTMTASYHPVGEVDRPLTTALIGRPIRNTYFRVVDPAVRLLPPGVAGELWIGGVGVARGYWRQAALTAQAFVPDPFATRPGRRLYRTGDLVRWRLDGELEFLGRRDQQIKLRGFRVEPAEIEAVLSRHSAVGQAVVVARQGGGTQSGLRLVAYVVPRHGQTAAEDELRTHLAQRLPAHLVPAAFVALRQLPRTANGKLDRGALPEPDVATRQGARWSAPRTPTEQLLAQIWSEVLAVEEVGAEDDFFQLGGHSLLATQVMARVRRVLGVEAPLEAIFETSTVAGLAARLDLLLRAGGGAPAAVERLPRAGSFELSFAQQRLWLLDRLEPGSAAYNIPIPLRLRGALNHPALAASLAALVERHEVLRTVYLDTADGPRQQIEPLTSSAAARLPLVDLGALPATVRSSEARRLAAIDARRPFDLVAGPVLRAALVRLSGHDHAALFTLHHIAGDAWSTGILVRELSALYQQHLESDLELPQPQALPPLPLQVVDLAAAQRQWLQSDGLAAHLAYWRQRLTPLPAALELPTDRPRSAAPSERGGESPLVLEQPLMELAREVGRQHGATVFMVLLAAFQTLLARHTGRRDIAVGTPVAGRSRLESEALIGCFVNTLVLRGDLGGRPTFAQLLARARQQVVEAHAHQELPFEKLVEEVAAERDLGRTPLFQVMLTHQGFAPRELDLPGLEVSYLGVGAEVAKFELELLLHELPAGIAGNAIYRTDLFDRVTVERWLRHFRALLEAGLRAPDQHLEDLCPLRPSEQHQLLVEWSGARLELPPLATHLLVAERARRHPEAVAVVDEHTSWTYGELLDRAGRVAVGLRSAGVGGEQVVALLGERSAEFLAAMLGIFTAGAAYLPLDPRHPAARHRQLLEQSGAVAVLRLGGSWPALDRAVGELGEAAPPRLDFDQLQAATTPDQVAELTAPPVDGAGLAYVLFTSGSTGLPKGAMVSHRGMLNHLLAKIDELDLGAGDTVAQNASQSFDISIWQLLAALLVGGRVRVIDDQDARQPRRLWQVVQGSRVTVLETVPSLLRYLLQELEEGAEVTAAGALRYLVPTGEALPLELCRRWLQLYPRVPLVNAYGPTECSDDVSHEIIRRPPPEAERQVAIGRALINTSLQVVDRQLRQVPLQAAGEICVGGVGVGRGYLRDPRRTAQVFVPDPHGGEVGGRLYRTGDLGRWRGDGRLFFLGRIDRQIKLRGQRIELGEIEAVLLADAAVREAVVVVREDTPGHELLVAYVVPTVDAEAGLAEQLRRRLEQRLPVAMVPAALVSLVALPLTANGKIDRRALPAPAADALPRQSAPSTPTEEILAQLWSEVLEGPAPAAEEDFFDRGGHSLLATRLISRVRSVFGVELPLRTVFEASRLAPMAARIDAARRSGRQLAPDLVPVPRDRDLPLSFAQQRLWFIDQLSPGDASYNVPTAVRLRGALEAPLLAGALSAVSQRHEVLRTTYEMVGEDAVQRIADPAPVDLPVIDLGALTGTDALPAAHRLAAAEAWRPFDLRRGPVLRAQLLRLAAADHVLLVTLHHIAADGWSMDLLVREVAVLYGTLAAGQPSPLPALPVQYADYAVWQRSWLRGAALEELLAYWRGQLADLPPRLALPTDRPRPAVPSARGDSHRFVLPAALVEGLEALGQRHGATLFITLLAAFEVLLYRHSGQDDFAVGSPIAGRNRLETEGLIGFLVNTLVLRARLAGRPAFVELLQATREVALDAHAHQDLPFERLVEELQPERSLGHTPLFQVMFALENTSAPGGEPLALAPTAEAPLQVEPLASGVDSAKFELTLVIDDPVSGADGLGAALLYSTDLFDATSAERLAEQLVALLEDLTEHPEAELDELSLLGPGQWQQLVVEPVGLADQNPANNDLAAVEQPLHQRFADLARRCPDAVAVSCAGSCLTYGRLDELASALAYRLVDLGVGPEVPVGLAAERSLELVVGLLAILKAGGAYLPLDPEYPAERRAFMLRDTGAPVLLVQDSGSAPAAPEGCSVLLLNEALTASPPAGSRPRLPAVAAECTAYVIYTSGSTGRPKGVPVSHRAVNRLFAACQPWFGFGRHDVWTLFHSYAFDFSVWELWGALLYGGRLVVVPYWISRSPADFWRLLEDQRVSILNQTPSAFKQLIPAALEVSSKSAAAGALRRVVFGGEALDLASLGPWFERFGDQCPRLVNMYGITETTVHVTYREVDRADLGAAVGSAIGIPLPDLSTQLLDRRGRPVPTGVVGEIFVSGAGLSRGYLGRPRLAAERFVPAPFGNGERLYRSGDLARRRPSGELQYLGRGDSQVKVRGFRIELGEISSALAEHPAVRQAVVLKRSLEADERLLAWVVGEPAADWSADQLSSWLLDKLPPYMVPSAFVAIDELPLTANGKLDPQALPDPASVGSRATADFAAPRTPLEESLAQIWADLLGIERVARDDSFFELGGHSLLATQLVARLRQIYGVELDLRSLFEADRLAAVAQRVEILQRGAAAGETPPPLLAGEAEVGVPQPLSYAQQRIWFLQRLEPASPVFNLPLVVELDGRLPAAVLERALAEVVARHDTLRSRFDDQDGEVRQSVGPLGQPPRLPRVDLSALGVAAGTELERRIAEQVRRPIDLARPPLLRAILLQPGGGRQVLAATVHHIVADQWSLDVLAEEVTELCGALLEGRPPRLAALPVQFADYVLWQRRWLRGAVLERLQEFWRQQLAEAPPAVDLPGRRLQPTAEGFVGHSVERRLDGGVVASLLELGRSQGASRFVTLLAAWTALLYQRSGQRQLVVGTNVANRGRAEVEGLIGLFVNTLAIRLEVAPADHFGALLRRTRERVQAAYAHQELPFEQVQEALRRERRPGTAAGLFQTMLVMKDTPAGDDLQQAAAASTPRVSTGAATFDLTLFASSLGAAGEAPLKLVLEYNTTLYDPSVESLLDDFVDWLEVLAGQPEVALDELQPAAAEGDWFMAFNDSLEELG